MYRKINAAHRYTGRITRDSSMRMSNKAEVGLGCISLIGIGIIFLLVLAVFI